MKIKPQCYACIYNQIFNLTKRMNLGFKLSGEIMRESAGILSRYEMNVTPPEIASDIYGYVYKKTGVTDPFKEAKKESIKKALEFKPKLKEYVKNSKEPLFAAVKVAIAGNVIDLGVNKSFDLEEEYKLIESMDFKINHYEALKKRILNSNTICYLADNAGENVFDEILIETIKEIKDVEVFYVVRGKPIINDVTVEDLKGLEIENLAIIIDSGVDTPGFFLPRANKKSKKIFYEADMVISKGMGNFEVLFGEAKRELFFLFKVKCEVVASEVGAEVGDYVLLRSDK
ncbi:damage-control phosphatase ARMT1 family protein [Caminibacter sp.]